MPKDALLDHLVTLTDDTGIVQHAVRDIPNRSTGYCTDDVARALMVAVEHHRRNPAGTIAGRLATTYLSFLHDAQTADGWFHNFLGYDRVWQDRRGSPDAVGRAIWALGYTWCFAARQSWQDVARRLMLAAVPGIGRFDSMRARAYAALGLSYALEADGTDAPELLDALRSCVEPIGQGFEREAAGGWVWCEEAFTYDNARLPEALLRAGRALGDARMIDAGIAMLAFYIGVVIEDTIFVPIGNDGWFVRGGRRARYGQQPLEAPALIDAVGAAVAAGVREVPFARAAESALAWFFGNNTKHAVLIANGGCCDGIDAQGRNGNMGAESTLAYIWSALAMERTGAARLHVVR